nr:sigma factor [uncultured Chryseobacterium sp.]
MYRRNPKKCTDQELYLLLQQKNKSAFDQLYGQYSCMLYGLTLQAVRSQEFAEEIVSETFCNVWNSVHSYHPERTKLSMWLINTLIATTKDYLSRKSLNYSFNVKNFPNFTFDIIQENAC